jgi:hypothetical protein
LKGSVALDPGTGEWAVQVTVVCCVSVPLLCFSSKPARFTSIRGRCSVLNHVRSGFCGAAKWHEPLSAGPSPSPSEVVLGVLQVTPSVDRGEEPRSSCKCRVALNSHHSFALRMNSNLRNTRPARVVKLEWASRSRSADFTSIRGRCSGRLIIPFDPLHFVVTVATLSSPSPHFATFRHFVVTIAILDLAIFW